MALHPIMFASKSLTYSETRYNIIEQEMFGNNIEQKALGIHYRLEIFHHYCFPHELRMITDHKPLVALFKKDVAALSQR